MNRIKEIINAAEIDLKECYDYLALLKSKNFNGLENFQPKLAETLYCLTDLYDKLKSKTKFCHKQDISYNISHSEIQLLLNSIKRLIKIGQHMGDIFAWYFYKDEPSKIQEHLNHQETGLFTPRLGGIGELEFLKKFQFIGDCLLILHANTNILRIADFSIYNPTDGIIGTVELKTNKTEIEEEANIVAHIVSEYTDIAIKLHKSFEMMKDSSSEKIQQSYIFNLDRFEKQVEQQKKFVNVPKTALINGIDAELDFTFIEKAYKKGISINDENCLIAITKKNIGDTFFDRFVSNSSEFPPIEILNEIMAKKFYQNKRENYPTLMTQLNPYIISPYYTPMFFNCIDVEIYKDILFENISIIILLNPTMFLKYFEKNGYEVNVYNKTKSIIISKIIKGNKVETNFNWIEHLLAERFIKTDCVLEIIKKIIDKFESNPNCKIEMKM